MTSVVLKDIRKTFGSLEVIKGIDLTVEKGEFCVFVGPSGCGKSTLLRMISGLETSSSGQILIDGEDVTHAEPSKRGIAMVFQSYALYPHLTVRENIGFGLSLAGRPKSEIAEKVEKTADSLQLTHLLDRKPKALSGGQRQRVAIGRAIIRNPKVFLFDEPLSNLDAALRSQMRMELTDLHAKLGATMIYVTHDQVEAMTLGQRIVVLKDGVIQQIDTPMALYDRPANLFVAGFLGSPAMNVLRGLLVEEGGLQLQLQDGGRVPLPGAQIAPQWLGRELAIGVRPEHLQPSDDAQGGFEATIEVIEPVGNEIFVNLSHGAQPLVMRVAPRTLPGLGERLRVAVRGDALHFFDAESGGRLEARESGVGNRESQ